MSSILSLPAKAFAFAPSSSVSFLPTLSFAFSSQLNHFLLLFTYQTIFCSLFTCQTFFHSFFLYSLLPNHLLLSLHLLTFFHFFFIHSSCIYFPSKLSSTKTTPNPVSFLLTSPVKTKSNPFPTQTSDQLLSSFSSLIDIEEI
jgi:hypothetical protein